MANFDTVNLHNSTANTPADGDNFVGENMETKSKKSIFKRWWFWTIIVLVIFYAIGTSGDDEKPGTTTVADKESAKEIKDEPTKEPAPAPTPAPEKKFIQIASWKGSGIKKTELFTTTNKEWVVRWKAENENVAGITQVMVYDADGGMVDIVVNAQGVGEDESFVRTKPGEYYLDINSANVDWTISVEEKR